VQVYAANNMGGGMVNATGTTLQRGYGLAIETEHYPDSPNHPAFPSTLLRPGEVLRSTTVFRMSATARRPAD
jgi:aldose 1-epimerase